mgnify:CR=1 FL=1
MGEMVNKVVAAILTIAWAITKGENGKDELAYTIGIDVAGGATMESHGNSGKLATLLDSYHPHNVTEIKIWEGIPHDNLFGLSTVALSSKTEIKSK